MLDEFEMWYGRWLRDGPTAEEILLSRRRSRWLALWLTDA